MRCATERSAVQRGDATRCATGPRFKFVVELCCQKVRHAVMPRVAGRRVTKIQISRCVELRSEEKRCDAPSSVTKRGTIKTISASVPETYRRSPGSQDGSDRCL